MLDNKYKLSQKAHIKLFRTSYILSKKVYLGSDVWAGQTRKLITLGCFIYGILERPNCAPLSFMGNSNYKSNEAYKIKHACLIYASFLHWTVDKSLLRTNILL